MDHAASHGPERKAPSLRVADLKPVVRNTLRGFCTVTLPNGLTISDVSIHAKGDTAWASLPSKPQIDRDGVALRGPDGKVRYTPILSWSSKAVADRFSAAVVAAVMAQAPDFLRGDGGHV
jgi:hypothetical protein